MNTFSMNTQVEESAEFQMWEDMQSYLQSQRELVQDFERGVSQLAEYGQEVPFGLFAVAVDEAWEHAPAEMRAIAKEFGVENAREMRAFVMGFAFGN